MLHKKYLLLIVTFLSCYATYAQVVDSTASSIVIFQDPRLEALNDRPAAVVKYLKDALNTDKLEEKVIKPETPSNVFNEKKVGNKTVTGTIGTQDGFRVQIYNGNSRQVAMTVKATFDKKYPTRRSYLSYSAPRYKIKVGNFETRKEADNFLKQIISIVPEAFVVPDIITVKHILVR